MQIRWNPPAETEAIDSIFSLLDSEDLSCDKRFDRLDPPKAGPSGPQEEHEGEIAGGPASADGAQRP